MKTPEDIEVIWVDSQKDLPGDYHGAYEAVSDTDKKTIYIIKDASKGTLEHEKYHILQKHPNKPKKPVDYLRQELEAELYAYNKIGYPRQIKGRLVGWANDILWRRYDNSSEDTIETFNSVINDLALPDRWISDWTSIKSRISKLTDIAEPNAKYKKSRTLSDKEVEGTKSKTKSSPKKSHREIKIKKKKKLRKKRKRNPCDRYYLNHNLDSTTYD